MQHQYNDDATNDPGPACWESDSARECAEVMQKYRVSSVPVVDAHNRLVGVITDRDLALRIVAAGRAASTRIGEIIPRGIKYRSVV
ncbi:MAG: CBS domain-containing protein [Planctomycetes bacterium]|nr:CBS domain-containing protein [Planctomycetota bacterium]NUQ33883.1 CBS domain-containing protein [Planctomycetaceae bacterium]